MLSLAPSASELAYDVDDQNRRWGGRSSCLGGRRRCCWSRREQDHYPAADVLSGEFVGDAEDVLGGGGLRSLAPCRLRVPARCQIGLDELQDERLGGVDLRAAAVDDQSRRGLRGRLDAGRAGDGWLLARHVRDLGQAAGGEVLDNSPRCGGIRFVVGDEVDDEDERVGAGDARARLTTRAIAVGRRHGDQNAATERLADERLVPSGDDLAGADDECSWRAALEGTVERLGLAVLGCPRLAEVVRDERVVLRYRRARSPGEDLLGEAGGRRLGRNRESRRGTEGPGDRDADGGGRRRGRRAGRS